MMLSKFVAALSLAAITAFGGGNHPLRAAAPENPNTYLSPPGQNQPGGSSDEWGRNQPRVRRIDNLPSNAQVERCYAFNFLSPNLNQIDGSSAGDSVYSAWDIGYGTEWNNLVSEPITYALDSPRNGDGRYSLNGQIWNTSLDGNGLPNVDLVDSLGVRNFELRVSVTGSFSTYNTGGSPYGNAAGGVPPGWEHNQPSNPGSMGLSHLWIDARSWNDTSNSVRIDVDRLEPGRYTLVLWLNPTNHDPPRSAKIGLLGQEFRFDHVQGVDYTMGNRMILSDVEVPASNLSFQFSTFQLGGTNMDSSLAGFAVIKQN
ncbi:MAG: hypothetical protein ACI8QC_001605 [Planctomycetota bacterium]|jgi:hypothetical protein